MTLDQVRDRIAFLEGWYPVGTHWQCKYTGQVVDHPVPGASDGHSIEAFRAYLEMRLDLLESMEKRLEHLKGNA